MQDSPDHIIGNNIILLKALVVYISLALGLEIAKQQTLKDGAKNVLLVGIWPWAREKGTISKQIPNSKNL